MLTQVISTFLQLFLLLQATLVTANTEKLVFLGPQVYPFRAPNIDFAHLGLTRVTPTSNVFSLELPRVFPSYEFPIGLESWYLLSDLEPGRRYEIRLSWIAIEPTAFEIDVFNVEDISTKSELQKSITNFAEADHKFVVSGEESQEPLPAEDSFLLLRLGCAADYYTNNKTLMQSPPIVHVDLVLDNYIYNAIPQTLVNTIIFLVSVLVFGWFLSNSIWKWLSAVAQTSDQSKRRAD